jgi:membrane protease YdiL (CAAX protease family)
MRSQRLYAKRQNGSPWAFFSLVFLLSIPIWVLAALAEGLLAGDLPVDLPISSLMFVAPMSAALILVSVQEGSEAAKKLLKRAFDYRRIRSKAWYFPILFLLPAAMALQYGALKLMGVPLIEPRIPVLAVAVSFVVFFIAALGEEVGWQGYAIGPLQDRWNALLASVILGSVWAAWHVVPFLQAGQTPSWIAWQGMNMIAARIVIVWLYKNTGKSVFAAILFHAMDNVTTVLLPNYGWPYDPLVALVIKAAVVAMVVFLWDSKTLAHYRYGRTGSDLQPNVAN